MGLLRRETMLYLKRIWLCFSITELLAIVSQTFNQAYLSRVLMVQYASGTLLEQLVRLREAVCDHLRHCCEGDLAQEVFVAALVPLSSATCDVLLPSLLSPGFREEMLRFAYTR